MVSSPREVSVVTIPFIMALAGVSSGVRRAATTSLASLLHPLLEQLPGLHQLWIPAHYPSNESLLVTTTQLMLVTDRGSSQLLLLLLRTGAGEG